MQFIDPTLASLLLAGVAVVAVVGGALAVAVLPSTLRVTRGDRMARHESIPTYYGRLHFTH